MSDHVRTRWTRPASLLAVAGVGLALTGLWFGWTARGVDLPPGFETGPSPVFFVGTLAFVVAGSVVATKRSSNPVGWILLSIGLVWLLSGVAGHARTVAFRTTGTVSASWMPWLWDVLWLPGIALVPALFLVFPDGRLPGRRWRPVLALLGIGAALVFVAVGLRPGPFTNTPVDNPFGIGALANVTAALEATGSLIFAAAVIASIAAPVVRYRRAATVQRYQLKWFMAAGFLVVAAWIVGNVLEVVGVEAGTVGDVRVVPLLALPVAATFAMLQHRLYDIDLVITKGLLYTGLLVIVGAVYLGVVVGVGALVGTRDGAGVLLTVAATALAALAFQPARHRLQHLANRAVYGQRASPYEVLASFNQRMAGAYPIGEAPTAMAEAVRSALRVTSCEVWLGEGAELRLDACSPQRPAGRRIAVPAGDDAVHLPGCDHTFPVRHDDQLLGAIGITLPPGERLSAIEERLVSDLAAAAWLVLDNAQLVRHLRTSRQRLVRAGDDQRRRIERDLHDGAQQRLLELALTLRMASKRAEEHGGPPAAGMIATAELQLRAALAELRDLARGIHPAILTERGLVAALESLAERAPLPITVSADGIHRLPAAAEAIANVIKHAGASLARVTLATRSGQLHLTIVDDGAGGADASAPGLGGLADRVAAVDGRFAVASPPGGGTRIAVELPCV